MPDPFRLHPDYDNPLPDEITDEMIREAINIVERGGSSKDDGPTDYFHGILGSAGEDRVAKVRRKYNL